MTTPLTQESRRPRRRAPTDFDIARDHLNPALYLSPRQAREAQMGTVPRPYYAPPPVGPSRNDILAAKGQLVGHRKAITHTKMSIAAMEARLSAMDPQRVVAVAVPGYTDPPERFARAKADKAAGVHSVIGMCCTPDTLKAHAKGELRIPEFTGFFHVIHDLKLRIVHARTLAQHTEAHNEFLESDLSRLDPQHVVAATVVGYADPPETVARAAAAKAAGEVPAANEGM